MLGKKIALIALIAAIASCSTNKKSSEAFDSEKQQNQVFEIRKNSQDSEINGDDIFSVSELEIEKSASKPIVVYFDTDSAKLSEKALEALGSEVLPEAKDTKAKKIVIEAHCDERGSKAYNQKLSQKRAKAVKNYLIKNGVKATKIKSIGYGETKPVALGHDEESWAKNRRAVTIVIEKK